MKAIRQRPFTPLTMSAARETVLSTYRILSGNAPRELWAELEATRALLAKRTAALVRLVRAAAHEIEETECTCAGAIEDTNRQHDAKNAKRTTCEGVKSANAYRASLAAALAKREGL